MHDLSADIVSTKSDSITYSLPDEYFVVFTAEVKFWLSCFGLYDWEVFFYFEPIDNGDRAQCAYSYVDKIARFILNSQPTEPRTLEDIKISAKHEVCELVLGELCHLTRFRNIPEEELEILLCSARHSVIHRFQYMLTQLKERGILAENFDEEI